MAGIWRAAAALVVMLGLGLSAAAQDSPPPEAGPASDFSTEGEEPPQLPAEIIEKTRARYIEAYERLTGQAFSA